MTYNFDELIDRRHTGSVKWDGMKNAFGRDDLTAMWVADMDFRTPPFVMDALRQRLEHEVLGYAMPYLVASSATRFTISVESGAMRPRATR